MIESDSWTGKFTLLIFVQTKKGWLVGLVQEGIAWWWGKLSKYLERGWNRKKGRGHKDFKKGGQAGSRGGCLKKGGGLEPPYELWPNTQLIQKQPSADILQKSGIFLVFCCEFSAVFQNQAIKFGQLIEREKYFSWKIMLKMRSGD